MFKQTILTITTLAFAIGGSVVLAIGDDVFQDSYGTFTNPDRDPEPNGTYLNIECLQYGTDSNGDGNLSSGEYTQPPESVPTGPSRPATAGDPPAGFFTLTPGVPNEIRFGRVPADLQVFNGRSPCVADPNGTTNIFVAQAGLGSSGFQFVGAKAANVVNQYFEIGRFSHINRTIERGAGYVEMPVAFQLINPVTGQPANFETTYGIEVDETSDFTDGSPATKCEYQSATAGQTVPNTATTLATLCADRVVIEQLIPLRFATFGETQVTIEIAGFARVDESNDSCTGEFIEGSTIYTAEQNRNPLCLLGRIQPGSLTIDKTIDGDAQDQTFNFSLVEQNQSTGEPIAANSRTINVTTNGGNGSSGRVAAEPGLYELTENTSNLPENMTAGEFVCGSDGQTASYVENGRVFIDLDSAENITCSITNTVTESAGPTSSSTTSTTSTTSSTTSTTVDFAVSTLPSLGVQDRALASGALGLVSITAGVGLLLVARRRRSA